MTLEQDTGNLLHLHICIFKVVMQCDTPVYRQPPAFLSHLLSKSHFDFIGQMDDYWQVSAPVFSFFIGKGRK